MFARYAAARYKRDKEREIYELYVTDTLYMTVQNTAGEKRGTMKQRYIEMIAPPKPEETRTPDEIVTGIKDKLKKMREEGE